MKITEYWAPYNSGGNTVDMFVCSPEKVQGKMPAILVIQEIWGVDEHIMDLARRYASAGYIAAAPDLYSNGGKDESRSAGRITELKDFLDRVPMSVIMNPDDRRKAIEKEPEVKAKRLSKTMDSIFSGRDMEGMVKALEDAVSVLRSDYGATSVGTVGYCMGGSLSFRMSMSKNVAGSVVYYGTAPEESILGEVSAPLLGLYGGEDHRISDAVPEVSEKMKSLGKKYDYVIYKGAQHAFFNDTRASFGAAAARDAWARTLEFFRQNLG